jgi:thiamine-phosphate pyrophosphorylase
VAGTVWPSASKPPAHPLLGADGLRAIVRATSVPVLAIGGVTLSRLAEVAGAGAAGAAGIGLFMGEPDESSTACRAAPLRHVAAAARAV